MSPTVRPAPSALPQNVLDLKGGALGGAMREELFLKQGGGWFRIVSGSMVPLLAIGDRVYARHVPPCEIKVGDIALFKHGSIFVTHRVIGFLENGAGTLMLQKGDAASAADLVDIRCVMGKVELIDKKGKLVRLDRGLGRAVNALLALRGRWDYRFREAARRAVSLPPGSRLRDALRLSNRALSRLNNGMVRRLLG